jgi:RecB family endonuclease NucS
MQDALRRNIEQLDPALKIVDNGKERHVESGFIDILAEDPGGALVVIELKAGEAPDSVIAQVLSYVASLQATERDRQIRALLVAREFPVRVRLAARAAGIRLITYGYDFKFTTVEGE